MILEHDLFKSPIPLKTPPGSSEFVIELDTSQEKPRLKCIVGKTTLFYDGQCIQDTLEMLEKHGDWMPLGNCDEQKQAKVGTLEYWARSKDNPIGGWYGLKKGLRGRFSNYISPLLEALGEVELEHHARNNRIRFKARP